MYQILVCTEPFRWTHFVLVDLNYTTHETEAALRPHVCIQFVYVHLCVRARLHACVGPSPLRAVAPDKVGSSGAATF